MLVSSQLRVGMDNLTQRGAKCYLTVVKSLNSIQHLHQMCARIDNFTHLFDMGSNKKNLCGG